MISINIRLKIIIIGLFISYTSWSQNNNTINYQAVAHSNNGTGETLNNTNIDVEISISSDTSISPEFLETHSLTTNDYGLFSLQIGSINTSDFEEIEWIDENFYLGVSINGENMGFQLLVSVPYSFSSIESQMVNGNTVESNVPANAVFSDNQTLSVDTDSLYISNGNAIAINNIVSADNDWTINGNHLENNNSGDVKIKNKLVIGDNTNPGEFQLIDGNQGAGRILKSDAQGNAQWVQIGSLGVGVMLKNVYDSNYNSIVDNAELVNGFQVGSDVPSGALFTDNQNLSGSFDPVTNILTVSIQNGNTHSADLSALINTDNQQLSGIDVDGDGVLDSITLTNSISIAVDDILPTLALSIDDLSDGYRDANQNLYLGNTPNNYVTGLSNVAIGLQALNANASGNYNVAVGANTLINSLGSEQTAVGGYALHENTNGYQNNAFGYYALKANTTGSQNNAFGYASLSSNTNGSSNTAMGQWSLNNNTTGSGNTSLGKGALYTNTLGSSNVAVGKDALYNNLDGASNAAIGQDALKQNINGSSNSALGKNSLENNLGSQNTAIGNTAGSYQSNGNQNTYIGYNANSVQGGNSINNATAIGANAVVGQSNSLILGNNANVGIGTSNPDEKLHIYDGNFKLSPGGSGNGGNIIIEGDAKITTLSGIGDRMVVANSSGDISTQPIPTSNVPNGTNIGDVVVWNGSNWVNDNDQITIDDDNVIFNNSISLSDGFFLAYSSISTLSFVNDHSYIQIYPNSTPSNRTVTLPNGETNGQMIVLACHYNVNSNGFRIYDSGNINLSTSHMDLYKNDMITLIWNGQSWAEMSRSNN